MKTLITAAEIKQLARKQQKTLYAGPDFIITPAALDTAKELGVEIAFGPAPARNSTSGIWCAQQQVPVGQAPPENCRASGFDPALIARIVGEVIACLDKSPKPQAVELAADPSGLKLAKGRSAVLEDFDTGRFQDRVKIRQLFGLQDGASLAAAFMAIEAGFCSRELKCDEVCYLIEGTLVCAIEGREYKGTTGDVLFLPGGARVAFSAPERAKMLLVTHPGN